MARRSQILGLLSVAGLLLGGCYPDLGAYTIQDPDTDAGFRPPTRTDGGGGTPNPIDLGTPCGDPHLLIATTTDTSGGARLLRWDVGTGGYCRSTPILEQQEGFGYRINDVDWHAQSGDVLGLNNAILGLDDAGFPAWRHQPFDETAFIAGWVLALPSPSGFRVAAFWAERSSSSLEFARLVDVTGAPTNERVRLPFGAVRYVAAHPSGDGRVVMANQGPLRAYPLNDGFESLSEADGVEMFPMLSPDFVDMAGRRNHLDTDLATGRLVMTHADGAFVWSDGAPAPTSTFSCPSFCEALSLGVAGPGDEVYAICEPPSGPDHLVVMRAGSCDLLIDGTSLDRHRLQDLALVREPR